MKNELATLNEHILDTRIVRTNSHWERHTWLRGHFPDIGETIQGWQGNETFVRRTVIKPIIVFDVRERNQDREV